MKKEDAVQLAASGAAAAAALLSGGTMPLLGPVPSLLRSLITERQERIEREFWIHMAEELERHSPGHVRGALEDLIYKTSTQENAMKVISTAWRSLLESTDPCVMPALGTLAAQYFNTPPDRFFRGLCRVLSDVSAAEFEELRKLMTEAAKLPADFPTFYVDYKPGRVDELDGRGAPMAGVWLWPSREMDVGPKLHIGEMCHVERLGFLLMSNGFEVSRALFRYDRPHHGGIVAHMTRPDALRIAELIGPPGHLAEADG